MGMNLQTLEQEGFFGRGNPVADGQQRPPDPSQLKKQSQHQAVIFAIAIKEPVTPVASESQGRQGYPFSGYPSKQAGPPTGRNSLPVQNLTG